MTFTIISSSTFRLTFVCFLLASPINCSKRRCGQQLPDGCWLYTSEDCTKRSREITEASDGRISWPQRVKNLHVQPFVFTSGSSTVQRVGLSINWTLPSSSPDLLKGVQVTVTALDDASQPTSCLLFDLSNSQWTHWTNESMMSYNVTLPALPEVYNWHVQLESLPSPKTDSRPQSVASVFVSTDGLQKPGPKPVCSMVVTMTHSFISVTVNGVILSGAVTSYDVILYECEEEECCDFCDLTQVSMHTVASFSQASDFGGIGPGLYRVWVQPSGQPASVCGRSPVIIVTHNTTTISTPSPSITAAPTSRHSAATATTTTGTATSSSSSITIANSPTKAAPQSVPESVDFTANLEHTVSGEGGSSLAVMKATATGDGRATVVAASVAVCVTVVILILALGVCYCWRRRARQFSTSGQLSCVEKLITSTGSHSTQSDVEMQAPRTEVSAPDKKRPASLVKVLLVSHSRLKHHTQALDALALYLQALCACDVTYFRWLLEDIRLLGPELWTLEQIESTDCVVFVHSPETRECYNLWKAGQKQVEEGSVDFRIVMAALDYLFEHTSSSKVLNVTFSSDMSYKEGCFLFQPTLFTQSSPCSEPEDPVKGEECSVAAFGSTDTLSVNPPIYRLMNDFSRLLADLHRLPNIPSVLRRRNLPIDADHLDTPEGQHLYESVASLGKSAAKDEDSVRGTVFGGTLYAERKRKWHHGMCSESGCRLCVFPELQAKGPASHFERCKCKTHKESFDYLDHASGRFTGRKEMDCDRDDCQGRKENTPEKKMDSGFDELSLSFIGPDELSTVDTDASSLAERFRAINNLYERDMEDCESCADCYTLGGRCV